ncbi:hypothetical protein [Spiroplasma sp. Moj]|uniref:hypothetical protein n=1 Tax=Spiroplasma sp. Moj TaxID=1922342 RepID=UPI0039EE1626|nr:hypothetical protein [Spiroplasma sp. Moj]
MWAGPPNIENFIQDRNVNLNGGVNSCNNNVCALIDVSILSKDGRSQVDKVNFPDTFTIDTKEITNDIKTIDTFKTNGLPNDNYKNSYVDNQKKININFLLQITKLSNSDKDKIREIYLQAYYTSDLKLKIRFSKILYVELSTFYWNKQTMKIYKYFGNDKNIIIDVYNPNDLGIRNKNINPVKITFKPR